MSEASATFTAPIHATRREDATHRLENPGRAFANGLLLALPLWGVIGVAIWAIV